MQFADIPGLDALKNALRAAHDRGKVAHAQLFTGRPCGAALPMALAYASFLMCQNRTEEDSCGTCAQCVRIKKLIHPDIHFFFPKIAASDRAKHEKALADALPKFREFIAKTPFGDLQDWAFAYAQENKNLLISREDSRYLLKNASMRAVEGGYKIIIIWYAERMNASAANAMLKTLEEPPEKTIYLLVAYQYEALLATITSRTQLVTVPPHQEADIQRYLKGQGADEASASAIARLSEGLLGAAQGHLQEENPQDHQAFQGWMLHCWRKDMAGLVRQSEDFAKSGKASQRMTLDYALVLLRGALLCATGQQPATQSEDEYTFVSKFADNLGAKKIEKVYAKVNEAMGHLDHNANAKITHLNLSLDILMIFNG